MAVKKRAKKKAKEKFTFERRWHGPSIGRRPLPKYITGSDLRLLVTQQLGTKLYSDFGFYIADGKYYCTPFEDAKEIIKNSRLDSKNWVRERFDCDDFAHVLKAHFAEAAYKDGIRRAAHCFGIVWGSLPGPHAINWMVNSDMKLRFVEPQNDRVFFPRKTDKDIYFMLV